MPIRVVTWNVNSLRVRLNDVLRLLVEHRPTVLCLQETKLPEGQFPQDPFRDLEYECAHWGEGGYNGVAILATERLYDVKRGLEGGTDESARVLSASVAGLRILNAYCPNGGAVEGPRFPEKIAFFARLVAQMQAHYHPSEELILCGDFNIAPEARDVYNPEALAGTLCFHPREHEALAAVRNWGLYDLFRRFHTEGAHYSWWDFRSGGFGRGEGLRIDHIWGTKTVLERALDSWIEIEERGRPRPSDHAPVFATLEG